MIKEKHPRSVIGISGRIGAGKTSFSKELSKRLNVPRVSIGDFVRYEAVRKNITSDKHALQQLGKDLFKKHGPIGLFQRVLAWARVEENPLIVLDGIRRVGMWLAVKSVTQKAILICLNISRDSRTKRVQHRDNLDLQSIHMGMANSIEASTSLLIAYADIVLDENPLEFLVAQTIKELQNSGVTLPC